MASRLVAVGLVLLSVIALTSAFVSSASLATTTSHPSGISSAATNVRASSLSSSVFRAGLSVLSLTDLPDLEEEQRNELDVDIDAVYPTAASVSSVIGVAVSAKGVSIPAASAKVEPSAEVQEFARWMLEANDGHDNTFIGSGIVDEPVAPSDLLLSASSLSLIVGFTGSVSVISVSGSDSIVFAISPALPAGLSFSTASGAITGAATAAHAATVYTITASNSKGSTTATVTVAVIAPAAGAYPPFAFSYSSPVASYAKDVKITANSPTVGGAAPFNYSVSPALPAGLTLSSAGYIKGTPTAVTGAASYVVTVVNRFGSSSAVLRLSVVGVAPSFSYKYATVSYVTGSALVNPATVTATSTKPVTFAVSAGSLPSGMSLDANTGSMSGTPGAVGSGTVTVKATSTAGNSTQLVSWSISATAVAPSGLAYSRTVLWYPSLTSASVTSATLSVGTSPVVYTVSPALPAGLVLNADSGAITGGPTSASASASYVISATNSAGNVTATVTIAVTVVAPQSLLYAARFPAYKVGVAVSNSVQVLPAGQSYTFAAASLPAGLSINPASGLISGTPTAGSPLANYVVSVSNAQGTVSAVGLSFAVALAGTNTTTTGAARRIVVTNTLTGTVAGFTADLRAQFIVSFASAVGMPADDISIGRVYDGVGTSARGFVTLSSTVNVEAVVAATGENDPDTTYDVLIGFVNSGDFTLPGFESLGVVADLVAVPSSSTGSGNGVVSSSASAVGSSTGDVASSGDAVSSGDTGLADGTASTGSAGESSSGVNDVVSSSSGAAAIDTSSPSSSTAAAVAAAVVPTNSAFAWGSLLGVVIAMMIAAVGVSAIGLTVVIWRRWEKREEERWKKSSPEAAVAVSQAVTIPAASEEKSSATFVSTEKQQELEALPVMGVVVPAQPYVAAEPEEEVLGFSRVEQPVAFSRVQLPRFVEDVEAEVEVKEMAPAPAAAPAIEVPEPEPEMVRVRAPSTPDELAAAAAAPVPHVERYFNYTTEQWADAPASKPAKERIVFHPGMDTNIDTAMTPRASEPSTPSDRSPQASPAVSSRSIQSPWLSSPRSLDAAGGYMLDGTMLTPMPQRRGLPFPSNKYGADSDAPSPFGTGRSLQDQTYVYGRTALNLSISMSLPGPLLPDSSTSTPRYSGTGTATPAAPHTPMHTSEASFSDSEVMTVRVAV